MYFDVTKKGFDGENLVILAEKKQLGTTVRRHKKEANPVQVSSHARREFKFQDERGLCYLQDSTTSTANKCNVSHARREPRFQIQVSAAKKKMSLVCPHLHDTCDVTIKPSRLAPIIYKRGG